MNTPRPLPLEPNTGPDFPVEALPVDLGPLVLSVADCLQVPVSMAAAMALRALSAACSRLARVEVKPGWLEPMQLYIGVVAPPGAKKSQVLPNFLRPIRAWEIEAGKLAQPAVRAARIEREKLESEIKKLKAAGDWAEVETVQAELDELPPCVAPQLLTSDVTAQKLGQLLHEHGRIAIISAEPALFATMSGQWNKAAGPELDIFLCAHAGDSIRVDRLSRESNIIDAPCLTVCVGLQPSKLAEFAKVSGVRDRGMLARFIWVMTPDTRGQSTFRTREIPREHRADYERCLRSLLSMELPRPGHEPIIGLSPEASRRFEDFFNDIERRIAPGGDLRNLDGWGEKSRGLCARIAGLYHLAEVGPKGSISLDVLERALAVVDWAIAHAKVAFDEISASIAVTCARDILEVVKRLELRTFTRRDVHQRLRDRTAYKLADSLDAGLKMLSELGWVRSIKTDGPGNHGPKFEVHTSLWDIEGIEGLSGTRGAA